MTIINSVIKGTTPTGTTQITTNGTHNVSAYEYADVQVPSPTYYVEKTKDANNVLQNGSTIIDLTGVTGIGELVLYAAYSKNTNITGSIDLSNITNIGISGCESMCQGCTGLTSADLSGLTVISERNACYSMFRNTGLTSADLSNVTNILSASGCAYMFESCSHLTNLDISNLTTIGSSSNSNVCQYMFQGCTGLTSVDLSSLKTITGGTQVCGYMFSGDINLTNVDLSSLEEITSDTGCQYMFQNCQNIVNMYFESLHNIKKSQTMIYMFKGCTSLQTVSFYALDTTSFGTYTNQFNNMLNGCSNVTVHFPMRIQSTIDSWYSVTNGFAGTNTTVLFDIVTTLTGADSNTYTRQQKDSTSTATAWIYNDTLYYTSGTTEPVVNDTIYSDAACTTAVTTISSIA